MSDKHANPEPESSGTELDDEELGEVFAGRMLRIASFYLRNHIKTNVSPDKRRER